MGSKQQKFAFIAAITILSVAFAIAGCSKQQASESPSELSAYSDLASKPQSTDPATPKDTHRPPTMAPLPVQKVKSPNNVLLFDISNSEIFNPDDVKELGYAEARDIFKSRGYAVSINKTPISATLLKDVNTLVIAGPMAPFTEEQVDVLADYVSSGGNVLITLHIGDVCYLLAERFGIQISNSVVAQAHDIFEDSPKNLVATSVRSDVLTGGVSAVAVRKSWGLRAIPEKNARVVVSTASDAWADMNPDDQYEQGEPVGSFGIVGAATLGKGKVVIVGDDAAFTNKTIDMASNRQLCENIANWFAGK